MKKVLVISKLYFPWIGGVEKAAQEVAEHLGSSKEFEVEVLCCQPKGATKLENINGIKVIKASSLGVVWGMPPSLSFFWYFFKKARQADIIAIHWPFPLADLALLLTRPKGKLIVHYHSDIVRQKLVGEILQPLFRFTLKCAGKIVVSNPNMIVSSPLLQNYRDKCTVVPYGVDVESIRRQIKRSDLDRIKKKFGKYVLFVGRLSYYKGVQYLVEAMKDVDANLVILGEGDEEGSLRNEVKRLKLESKVYFLKHQPQEIFYSYFAGAEVFVLPSIHKSEAFGIVIIEAMACKIPVVSTELGTGTSWINADKESGRVVSPGNSKALSDAINEIICNPKKHSKYSETALRFANERFTKKIFYKSIGKIYTDI